MGHWLIQHHTKPSQETINTPDKPKHIPREQTHIEIRETGPMWDLHLCFQWGIGLFGGEAVA